MPKDQLFFKDFSSGSIFADLSFTAFFATAIFFELAIGSIFNLESSQNRISLAVGFFMVVGVGFFLFLKKIGNKGGSITVTAILSAVFLSLKFYYF